MNIFLQKLLRLIAAVLIIAIAIILFPKFSIPRFSDFGLLGVINQGIVIYLLLLVGRHFGVLFFSAKEQIRRENISRSEFAPKIALIVPAYNEEVVIADTIRSLQAQHYPDFEVMVIDDGSTDGTYEAALKAAEGDPRIRVFKKPNAGKGEALNFGIARCTADFVFCMDADSQVSRGALFAGVRHLEDGTVSAVAGSVYVINQNNALGRFQALEYMIGLNFFKAAQSYLGLVTIIPGPSGLFRKADLIAAGGYTNDTFAEDCDLTLQLVMKGRRIVYEPLMEVRTEAPEKLVQLVKQRYRWNRGILQAMKKHMSAFKTPRENPVGVILMLYLIVETVALPLLNVVVASLSLVYTAATLDFRLLSLWLFQLTLLDLTVVIFALADTRWPFRLLFYSIINRFTYAFFLEVVRALSTIEEVFGVRMNWGKLERIGVKV